VVGKQVYVAVVKIQIKGFGSVNNYLRPFS
jgi:hypothetical protein